MAVDQHGVLPLRVLDEEGRADAVADDVEEAVLYPSPASVINVVIPMFERSRTLRLCSRFTIRLLSEVSVRS